MKPYSLTILNNIDLRPDEEVIEELQKMGIPIIYKPLALVPDTFGNVEMDIHEALREIKIRKIVIGDPFSEK